MAFLVIILICYFVVALIRTTPLKNEWLPLVSGALGIVLAVIAYYALPEIVPSTALEVTVAYGFFCGLAATGSNQVFKQTLKYFTDKFKIPTNLLDQEDKEE